MKPIEIRNPNFRPGTHTERKEVVFSFLLEGEKSAALGDCISWLPAIRWIAEEYNFVVGHLIVPHYMLDLVQNVMREFPHWRVHPSKIPGRLQGGYLYKKPTRDIPNATTMHLVDLGFLYFAGVNPVPEGAGQYPRLDLSEEEFKYDLPEKFAIMTPGNSAVTRKMPADVYNGISDHLIERGITPVHLGTTKMDKRSIEFDGGYDLTKGIDLTYKTTLLQAALVIDHAEMIIGIDNGLMHLAGMTDTTMLYGYTMVGPKHRRIERPYGRTYELYGDKEKLPCLFCQEKMRFFLGHDFTTCMYKEHTPSCVKALNLESWCATIDLAIKENENESRSIDKDDSDLCASPNSGAIKGEDAEGVVCIGD